MTRLRLGQPRNRASNPVWLNYLSFLQSIQTVSVTYPASYPIHTRDFFPCSKVAGDVKLTVYLHLVAELKSWWNCTSILLYTFMACKGTLLSHLLIRETVFPITGILIMQFPPLQFYRQLLWFTVSQHCFQTTSKLQKSCISYYRIKLVFMLLHVSAIHFSHHQGATIV